MAFNVPKRTAYAGPPLSGPGIIYTTSKIIKPEELSVAQFHWWYENVHIKDLLATSAISAAFRFKNINPSADATYLAIYVVPDLAALQQSPFKSVPQTHECLPGGGPAYRFVDFDTRFYRLIQNFEVEEHPTDWYPALISAAVEPAEGGDEDLDKWYRDEHLNQATTQPGWKRTTRYELVFQVRNDPGPQNSEDAPKWLALHQWEKGFLGPEVEPFNPMSQWTKTVMESAKNIQASNYEKIGSFGL